MTPLAAPTTYPGPALDTVLDPAPPVPRASRRCACRGPAYNNNCGCSCSGCLETSGCWADAAGGGYLCGACS